MKIVKLKPAIQHYAWGDKRMIPEILSMEADGQPWAELWLGTHHKGPSYILSEESEVVMTLQQFISEYPEETLGSSRGKFGELLPFLLKILAVDKPLSIQCHPSLAQAKEGYEREERLGIPVDAANRSYKDSNHKPEIICAITPYTALCGFRKSEEIDKLFSALESEVYNRILKPLLFTGGADEQERYGGFFSAFLTMEPETCERFLAELGSGASRLKDKDAAYQLVLDFLSLYPEDNSAAAPLFLNLIELQPGEALYQPAGELHAYVRGTGVELMANSDNVLRGGLTPKFIDIDELRNVVVYRGLSKQKTVPEIPVAGFLNYPVPVDEFSLSKVVPGASVKMDNRGAPEILLCTAGTGAITYERDGSECRLPVARGDSYFIPAVISRYSLEAGDACDIFLASVPVVKGDNVTRRKADPVTGKG